MTVTMDENIKKLENEIKSLAQLREVSGKFSNQTGNMSDILSLFDDRLAKLEQTIQPVYKKTGNLQQTQGEIMKTLSHLDYIIQFYTVANQMEPIISAGPSAGQLETFMKCLDSLKEAIDYFEHNNPESPELMNVSSLFEQGGNAIEREFKQILLRHSSPIAPVAVLDMINTDDSGSEQLDSTSSGSSAGANAGTTASLSNSSSVVPSGGAASGGGSHFVSGSTGNSNSSHGGSFRRSPSDIPQEKINELRTMCDWLCMNRNDDFIAVYAELRAEMLFKTLMALQTYQKAQDPNVSSRALYGTSTTTSSTRSSLDSPTDLIGARVGGLAKRGLTLGSMSTSGRDPLPSIRRTPKSIQQAFKRRFHYVLPGEVLGGGASGSGNSGGSSSGSGTDQLDGDTSINEREIIAYLTCITALHKLVSNELTLMSGVINEEFRGPIFNRLIQPAIGLVVNEASSLSTRVKRSIARHDFQSALNLFPILRHQTMRRHNFELLFDGCQSDKLSRFQGLIVTFQTTINRALEEFVEFVQAHSDPKVPDDGTVHELTHNVMIFMVRLYDYLDILATVITMKDLQFLELHNDKNKLAYAQYITRLLSALGLNVQKKRDLYTSKHLGAIFMLNNYHYILKTLRLNGLLDIVHTYNSDVATLYDNMIEDETRLYLCSWDTALNYIGELNETRTKSIKDRFAGFNKELIDIHRSQRAYSVPDADLRHQLRALNKNQVCRAYRAFYDRYVAVDFTKNKDKYVKFTPERVSFMIDEFFDSL